MLQGPPCAGGRGDEAWPVAPADVSQIGPKAGTALGREILHCESGP